MITASNRQELIADALVLTIEVLTPFVSIVEDDGHRIPNRRHEASARCNGCGHEDPNAQSVWRSRCHRHDLCRQARR
jgi:hypothetical protein